MVFTPSSALENVYVSPRTHPAAALSIEIPAGHPTNRLYSVMWRELMKIIIFEYSRVNQDFPHLVDMAEYQLFQKDQKERGGVPQENTLNG